MIKAVGKDLNTRKCKIVDICHGRKSLVRESREYEVWTGRSES
jgi:hypothetical protein